MPLMASYMAVWTMAQKRACGGTAWAVATITWSRLELHSVTTSARTIEHRLMAARARMRSCKAEYFMRVSFSRVIDLIRHGANPGCTRIPAGTDPLVTDKRKSAGRQGARRILLLAGRGIASG